MSVEAERIFREAGLRIDVKRKMRDLSLDEEQVFLLLKAFSVDKKEFVLLDEVTTSFSRKEQEFFFRLIADQKSKGKLIIFISHRLDEILQVCDRVTVLRDGRVAGTVERRELDRQVLSSMVVGTKDEASTGGRTGMPEVAPAGGTSGDSATVLSVRGFCLGGGFEDVSFQLRAGEILGLAGLVGSGRSELLRAIAGILPPEAGTLELSGHEVGPFRSPSQAIRCGVVYLTENRDEDGLVNIHSVMHNLTLSYLIAISRGMLIDRANVRRTAEGLVASLEIVASSLEEEVQNLSGGNRQKVLLGRVASTRAKVLLLDEPTKGIDISAKRSILKSIRNDLSRHSGIIMTSPGLEEILEVSDRILVLHEGRVTREFARNEFDELAVYRAIQGIGS
jgi:ABC-type sugar transport system ATPase subunit